MTDEQIKEIALANGFKLKEQPNGDVGLNPYVYDFARALISSEFDKLNTDLLTNTVSWFKEAKPEPTSKDICVQLGCHYEEMSEMCAVLFDEDNAISLTDSGEYLKQSDGAEELLVDDKVELLDALADQIVTAVGVAYMMGFDIIGALTEVNASNWSKFESGKAVTDENGKIKKGSEYFPPDLTKFV